MTDGSADQSLKLPNYGLIFVYTTAHLIFAYTVLFDLTPTPDMYGEAGRLLGGGAIGAVFSIILVELVGGSLKARLVYLRWRDPLPGRQAFTVHIHEDPRIDKARLNSRYGPFSTNPRDQNVIWYKLLRRNSAFAPVSASHRRYLLFRDLTWIALILLVVVALVSYRSPVRWPPLALLCGFLFAELVILRAIAARCGHDFVRTVLAIESARED